MYPHTVPKLKRMVELLSLIHILREIERIIGKKFIQGEMPTGKQICEKQLLKVIDELLSLIHI